MEKPIISLIIMTFINDEMKYYYIKFMIYIFIICLLLILCCDWSDHGHMTTLQN